MRFRIEVGSHFKTINGEHGLVVEGGEHLFRRMYVSVHRSDHAKPGGVEVEVAETKVWTPTMRRNSD